MTLLYFDPLCLQHDTGKHPENATRVSTTADHLLQFGLNEKCERPVWQPATLEQVQRVHRQAYLQQLSDQCKNDAGRIEADTVVCSRSFDVALHTAGAAIDATTRVINGEHSNAFCLMRPPGHHALANAPMGFCLLNHAAIAARHAITQCELNRVLIVDWDVHHGNGTQDIFWEEETVGFFSMHRFPFYPGSGEASEVGQGKGLGTTLNLPIHFGSSRRLQLDAFRSSLERFADKIQPELLIISAGFDSHRLDPVGSLGLESEDFIELTQTVLNVAKSHARERVVSLLEGGYHPQSLAESVACHLTTLLEA